MKKNVFGSMESKDEMSNTDVSAWSVDQVGDWIVKIGLEQYKNNFKTQSIDGLALLMITETDLKQDLEIPVLGHVKRIIASIVTLQHTEIDSETAHLARSTQCPYAQSLRLNSVFHSQSASHLLIPNINKRARTYSSDSQAESTDVGSAHVKNSSPWKSSGVATNLTAEYFRTLVSCFYMFLVTWITAIVMVFVHDRVPDKERHPPLPDIFLDNVPHISWAFQLCEITILILTVTWIIILYFHKHRSILIRRFSALSGSVFLLRCSTMFITSLSVPGHHLECSPREQSDIWTKFQMASVIWRGGGLSIKGVRTCGDYMFSGHTTALTLLNFFITEYTPRRMYFLHITSWVLNTFGIFFILAAHEHYSIDVFIAFYITSRMFLYYHSLANNRALQQRDSFRTKIWFPMFSYFEAHIDGMVPNEYVNPLSRQNLAYLLDKVTTFCDSVRTTFVQFTHSKTL